MTERPLSPIDRRAAAASPREADRAALRAARVKPGTETPTG
ncbi:hypothetical protein OIE62_36690 [Streptomyces scopuliridis]|uniref:Uncharacterized protein n=1 Tax=Streptomyces scopuliridis TaxID=452529 RepID=A0ACD4ZDB4_9ACTN|nr:hypothetical protein [Streptomyces scopuliridis]WSB96282.1 hypothetical protein OG835_04235 [Streptomyces scopuliridis]WSC10013.1 hypothetical protein OIE62_36690 [Streptomyces scopuliridis]